MVASVSEPEPPQYPLFFSNPEALHSTAVFHTPDSERLGEEVQDHEPLLKQAFLGLSEQMGSTVISY